MSKNISMFFTNFKNYTYEFPIAPESVKINKKSGNEKTQVIYLGEINRLAHAADLASISMKVQIPIDLTQRRPYWTAQRVRYPTVDGGSGYINVLNTMFNRHEVIRVVFSNTRINQEFTIDEFSYELATSGDEYIVEMTLTEWRDYAPLVLKRAPLPKKSKTKKRRVVKKKPRPRPKKRIGVGSVVIVNGQLHRDSYGSGPGVVEHNAKRRINFTAPGRRYPYHVTLLNGGWRGWVKASAVKAV